MAIYKLGDILGISNGSTPSTDISDNWKDELLWYTPIDLRKNTHTERKITAGLTKTLPKNSVLISSRAPIGYIGIANKECWHSQGIKGFINDEKHVLNKYLYYWSIANVNEFISRGVGSTFAEISSSSIKSISMIIPDLQIQQAIIDIIEPIEHQIEFLNTYLKKTEMSGKLLSNEYIDVDKMINNCIFEKGKNHDGSIGEVPFLNVSAANDKINNYCNSAPNTQFGDVMLSLDGNTGLVNNFMNGYNGYLYKVWSSKFKSYEIYYSLKTAENQTIIKRNETGTTIKHSPNSKKYLKIFSFKNKESLEQLFEFEILLKKQLVLFESVKKHLINLLLK